MPETTTTTTGRSAGTTGASIALEAVTKRYPGQARPAVDAIDLRIEAGEILVLVGPSGCGKTTTLKMINRLIEPTSGRIVLDGEDVTTQDADRLRRRIGYVIQAGGLFPHMTVGTNIALVPKMLGWDKARIAARTAELLELVGLDPATYRDRYPRELSGGQQQRVGVARALAADPPVLLMDEPFGAVDPITRHRLQNELLSIQAELGKTIVMVTHDFDEAVKLGDRIAILDTGARVVQLGTPEEILTRPAEDFVVDFVGKGAALKTLTLATVGDARLAPGTTAAVGTPAADAVARARAAGHRHVVVVDADERPLRWARVDDLDGTAGSLDGVRDPSMPALAQQATLHEALDTMLTTGQNAVVVTGPHDRYLGQLTLSDVVASVAPAGADGPGEDGTS